MFMSQNIVLPLLPLRDIVVFPNMVVPLFVGRAMSINALNKAMSENKRIVLVAQRNASDDQPKLNDLHTVGTLADVLQVIKLNDGTIKVLVEGVERVELSDVEQTSYLTAHATVIDNQKISKRSEKLLVEQLKSQFDDYAAHNKKLSNDVVSDIAAEESISDIIDKIAGHADFDLAQKQEILEQQSIHERAMKLIELIETAIDIADLEEAIRERVKQQMEKSQREYYLNEKIKAIRKELGDDEENEEDVLKAAIEKAGMPKEVKEKAMAEVKKLSQMSMSSAEATVVRGYLDWLINLPWKKRSKIRFDIDKAQHILNVEHYGLKDIKERILEYLAVQSRVKKAKGPIMCLVGPPGVGKTSLGRSIAEATGRKYIRMALGGLRDESEIRGHRRTYIGAMPGKLIQRMSKVGVKNPLFLLDEIDKISSDFRGDPSAALLEVLDPEQNNSFSDNYLEVDYDLSEVMFVCTANSMNIPGPLLDRMEVIRVPGYTEDEKVQIAIEHLLPKQIKENGLVDGEVKLNDKAVRHIVRYYTREAGVRGLNRVLSKLCRKIVKRNLVNKGNVMYKRSLTTSEVEKLLGTRLYSYGENTEEDRVGQVTGLAWTSVGGDLLTIEAVSVKGKGKYIYTGSLGDVMKESIQAAMTVVRSRARSLGVSPDFYAEQDVHIHVPEGATPKDGPSAGIAMCTALVSSLTNTDVRSDVAMTGEITLRGEVLAIGGLKEKLLAAHRGNIKTVIIPKENERDLPDIPENVKKSLDIRTVQWIDEVFEIALTNLPTPLPDDPDIDVKSTKKSASTKRRSAH